VVYFPPRIFSKHESVLEHGAITVRFICDRGVMIPLREEFLTRWPAIFSN
jgi:hypothetical protein